MKRIMTLFLAAGLVLGAHASASAIDFKAKGEWLFGFGAIDNAFVVKKDGRRTQRATSDKFAAVQQIRLGFDAVVNEYLSGTVIFEIGNQNWGRGAEGAALGADGVVVEVMNAYLDWTVPNTDLRFRMGIHDIALPNTAGNSGILYERCAGIIANYKFNDQVSLMALWARPFNDNYTDNASTLDRKDPSGYLDNMDLFALSLPIMLDGWQLTPWAAVGMIGRNAYYGANEIRHNGDYFGNNAVFGTTPFSLSSNWYNWNNGDGAVNPNPHFSKPYSSMFFVGLPIVVTAFDPLRVEVDLNYGYSEGLGRYTAHNYKDNFDKRSDTRREGWLAKALVEYKLDWGTPGLIAWYGSGDDNSVKNGSERMPTISPLGNFTSFFGDAPEYGWAISGGYDQMMSYSGTWGLGVQLKNVSFLEGLKHTFRMVYWGGTNSPGMVKYLASNTAAVDNMATTNEGLYLTTNDGMLEFNLVNTYQIYENLQGILDLGYIVNCIDKGTWNRYYYNSSFQKGDAYKAGLMFRYSF